MMSLRNPMAFNSSEKSFGFRTVTSLGISSRDAAARFEKLQQKLIPLWKAISEMNQHQQTIVVVPSLTVVGSGMGSMEMVYEERFLFLLFLLRQPNARMIYLTSKPVMPSVVDYYLSFLPEEAKKDARDRLFLVDAGDGSSRSLVEKLLERPRLLRRIRNLIADPDWAHLIPFNTTILERDLALRLGIPMYAADPKFLPLGLKSGCRRLFAEEGVPHPRGYEDLNTIGQVAEAICKLRSQNSAVAKVIVKLNEGVSGEGNAILDVTGLPEPGSFEELDAVTSRLKKMQMQASKGSFKEYSERLALRGGIVEEMIQAEEVRSPSVQMRVTPLGELQILSTHDQLLGGKSGQNYLGAKFPADPEYAALISREAAKIGERLAREGVIGRFAVDFLVLRSSTGGWNPYAIELNLRKGGTTHPFLTLEFLTGGRYDPETATFTAPGGSPKCLVASDHIKSPLYRALIPEDVFDLAERLNLRFDSATEKGVVFHMMSGLSEHGRIGLTAIGDSHHEAQEIYERMQTALNEEAEHALDEPGLPDF